MAWWAGELPQRVELKGKLLSPCTEPLPCTEVDLGPRSSAWDTRLERGGRARPPFAHLLQLAVHVQVSTPLDAQQVQLLPQGRIPYQLDVKVTGDLGWVFKNL